MLIVGRIGAVQHDGIKKFVRVLVRVFAVRAGLDTIVGARRQLQPRRFGHSL